MRHTRNASQRQLICIPYLVLLQTGFTMRALLPDPRWALTPPFHPYPLKRGGLLSVALSLGSHRADIIRRLVSMEPGLSSRNGLPHYQRLPGHLIDRSSSPDFIACPDICQKLSGQPCRAHFTTVSVEVRRRRDRSQQYATREHGKYPSSNTLE